MKSNKKSKLLILTHQLGANYGGIMQAYALQSYVKKLSFSAKTTSPDKQVSFIKSAKIGLKRYMLKTLFKRKISFLPDSQQLNVISKNTRLFIEKNINTINLYENNKNPKSEIDSFDNIIIGSDQVWRAVYVDVPLYLLSFVKSNINRISYAASFGRDDLSEYSPRLIKKTARLAKKFNAISVREDSGIDLCKKYWGVNAIQHIDPTLLLTKNDYTKLINDDAENLNKSKGNLFTYILDKNSEKQAIVKTVAGKTKLTPFEIMPPTCKSNKDFRNNSDKYILPPVTQWLKSFADAEYIITDSFHGCAFSIIFNKPFIAIGNSGRGLTRFISLLKLFCLENRLISNVDDLTDDLIFEKIDWEFVNKKIKSERQRSKGYLTKNLNGEVLNLL